MFNSINEALEDLKQGKVVIVCDDEKRENEGDFIALAEFASAATVNFLITHGKGLVCMPVDEKTANRLNLHPMVNRNTDNFRTAFTVSIDHITTGTGISAHDRLATIKAIVDPNSSPNDFRRPGHLFPLVSKNKGVLERPGHTEAVVDLARLCNSSIPAGILCEIINDDGSMARYDDLVIIAKKFNLKMITIKDLVKYRKLNDTLVKCEATAKLPTRYGNFTLHGYSNLVDATEIPVIIKGSLDIITTSTIPPLVRIHSECLTGDVFHSLRCDCGEQLEQALTQIEQAQSGIIIYLRQEGRGIGLINKIKAYQLQEQNMDTYDANLKLGFSSDHREYFLAAQILRSLNITKVRLITNNPEKINGLNDYGIDVAERVPLHTVANHENSGYLYTKAVRFGHML
jgi:3,4-dihydroxy 2-butanone 4-phosphate synthase / GTP cyclohydrolase II